MSENNTLEQTKKPCDCDYKTVFKEAIDSGSDIRIMVEFLHYLNYHSSDGTEKEENT